MRENIWVHPRFGSTLRSAGLSGFSDFMNLPATTILSRHKTRETVLVHLNGASRPTFYLKREFRASLFDSVKDLIRFRRPRSKPQREWSAIHALQQRDIPVVGPVAVGWQSRAGLVRRAFILLEPAVAPTPLTRYLLPADSAEPTNLTAPQRAALLRDLGRFLRRMHEAGVRWPDLDVKHIHVQPPSNGRSPWRFELLDVERLSVSGSNRSRREDLRRFWDSAPPTTLSRSDLLRLATAYTDAPIRTAFRWAAARWRELSARAAGPVALPADFVDLPNIRFVRSGDVVFNEAFAPMVRRHGLNDFDAWGRLPADRRFDKPGLGAWRTRTRLTVTDANDRPVALHLKRFRRPPLREQLRRVVLRKAPESSAWYEWTQIKMLTGRRIGSMTPVAYGQRMIGPYERDSFLVTADIPGQSLERWGPENFRVADTDPTIRRPFLRRLAHFVAAFHRAGFVHRDLYLSHIFLDRPREGEQAFRLIDLQRVFCPVWRKRRWLVKDLAALNFSTDPRIASRTERMRFLREYLPAGITAEARRRLTRAILRKTRAMAQHNPHLQNPLDPIQQSAGTA